MRATLKTRAAMAGISSLLAAAVALPLASAAPAAAKSAARLPQIIVTMTGRKITVGGALHSGGVQIVSKVTREPQGDPTFVRLDPGVTVAQFLAALPKIAADPNNIDGIGSIVLSPQADKGVSSVQANLAAGLYVALDLGSNAKIPPLTHFTIGTAASPARLPRPRAHHRLRSSSASAAPARLHDGELVRFANPRLPGAHDRRRPRLATPAGARSGSRGLLKGGPGRQGGGAWPPASPPSSALCPMAGFTSRGITAPGPATGCWPASWTPRTAASTPQLGMERVIRIKR